jgi:hypothetical protein
MAKIQNNFLKATVDKDLDERLTPNGVMTDAVNFMVTSEDGSSLGVGKNVVGNILSNSLNDTTAVVIGSIADDSNERIFFFAHSNTYDYVAQYNLSNSSIEILLKSTADTGVLNFDLNYRISHSDIFVSVEGESLLSWTDGLNPPRIIGIERAKAYSVNGFTDNEISVMKPSPIFAPTINLINSDLDSLSNFLEDKFLSFAYRYKYQDGHYSAISSWSQVAFLPSSFQLDYQTYENLGMVNLANAVQISFNCGDRHVVGVDLLFKESESSTVYVIDKFIKSEEGWNIPNQQITYTFSGNKIYSVLEESQYFRNFDNVPLTAKSQARIGNRLVYGNFIEGRNIDEKVKLEVDYLSTPLTLDDKDGVIEDVISVDLYSNVVDFERGNDDGGSSPVDQMNFLTNTLEVDLVSISGATQYDLIIDINPKGSYSSSTYNLYAKNGSTTLYSYTDLTGVTTISNTLYTDEDITFYITSDDGLIYDLKLNYNVRSALGAFLSRWDYYADDQLCYPKDGGYDSTLQGDTIIQNKVDFDFTNFDFVSGTQMRFDFDTQSSLVYEVKPSFTFFYNLTSDYASLSDFLANSNFVYDLENTFSESFVTGTNAFASNAGVLVLPYEGFKVTSVGDILTIINPHIIYEVTEDSGITENKDDFYLNTNVVFGLYSEDAFSSMHSNRNYVCDIIYLDDKGRKTTVLSGGNTSVYIPSEVSDRVNKLKVTTVSNPPSWAKYYKFAIKDTKREYNTIYGNVVYEQGIYRWIKLVGENKSKIKEGDILWLKSDYSGVTDSPIQIKVLEVSTQVRDFIEGNVLENGDDLIEESGLYFKIKQGAFDINLGAESNRVFEGFGKRRYASRSFVSTEPLFGEYDDTDTFIPIPVNAGTQIKFKVRIWAKGAIAFNHEYEVNTFSQEDYASVKDWWDAEVSVLDSWEIYSDDYLKDYEWTIDDTRFRVKPWRDGTASRDIMTQVTFEINFSGGTLMFENYGPEQLDTPYYESVETYTIVDGNHFSGNPAFPNAHILSKTFNCFTFGNGCESNCVRDSFRGNKFYINSNPSGISDDVYRQINRYADLTYSGVYQESTNINKLNEFNLSLANYKDDLEKRYGPIVRLSSDQTDLLVIQEDRVSKVLYGKDLLYNTDATTNLSRIESVLGQQVIYAGDYGISFHPESFVDYGTNKFFTDTKRGTVMRLNDSNGLEEISKKGMTDYFKKLFRDNTINNIIGSYDSFYDTYVLNIKYNGDEYVTWLYSDEAGGFLTKVSYNPDSMIKLNNEFITFKEGGVYLHNRGVYNRFYNTSVNSSFNINFSQEPSTRKLFKTISTEGDSAWDISVYTDLQNGYINASDFQKKEGVYYAYIRGNQTSVDTATLSSAGIGNVSSINGLEVVVGSIVSTIVSIGDFVYNQDMEFIGIIQDIEVVGVEQLHTLTLNQVNSLAVGDFILSVKSQSVETSGLLGYYMNVMGTLSSPNKSEIYAVNAEISKSFE